jgi:hypothetical protein
VNIIHQPLPEGTAADDEMFDVVNLATRETGVTGTIFVSTAQGAHGPRVKWYPGRPGREVACLTMTLEAVPQVINHGLSRIQASSGEAQLREWVRMNRAALLDFWENGVFWTRDEVNAFFDGLAKLP